MKKGTKVVSKIIVWIILIMILLGAIGFMWKFTNGMQEDFKFLYLSYQGRSIVAENSEASLTAGVENRFDIKYMLDPISDSNTDKVRSIEIMSNEEFENITYTVDGKEYLFGDLDDFSDIFNVQYVGEYFTVSVPQQVDLGTILSLKYPKHEVSVSPELLIANDHYYLMRVILSNGAVYNIKFNFTAEIDSDLTNIVF